MRFRARFKSFKPFNRFAPFKPPPLSSPATRGRMKEGLNLERFERLERLEPLKEVVMAKPSQKNLEQFDAELKQVFITGQWQYEPIAEPMHRRSASRAARLIFGRGK